MRANVGDEYFQHIPHSSPASWISASRITSPTRCVLTPSTIAISLYRSPSARKWRHCRCCDVSRQTAETMRVDCSFLRTTSSGLSLASILDSRNLATRIDARLNPEEVVLKNEQ